MGTLPLRTALSMPTIPTCLARLSRKIVNILRTKRLQEQTAEHGVLSHPNVYM